MPLSGRKCTPTNPAKVILGAHHFPLLFLLTFLSFTHFDPLCWLSLPSCKFHAGYAALRNPLSHSFYPDRLVSQRDILVLVAIAIKMKMENELMERKGCWPLPNSHRIESETMPKQRKSLVVGDWFGFDEARGEILWLTNRNGWRLGKRWVCGVWAPSKLPSVSLTAFNPFWRVEVSVLSTSKRMGRLSLPFCILLESCSVLLAIGPEAWRVFQSIVFR